MLLDNRKSLPCWNVAQCLAGSARPFDDQLIHRPPDGSPKCARLAPEERYPDWLFTSRS
jgi:hypothetical protein